MVLFLNYHRLKGAPWSRGRALSRHLGGPGSNPIYSLFMAVEFYHLKLKLKSYSNLTQVTGSIVNENKEKEMARLEQSQLEKKKKIYIYIYIYHRLIQYYFPLSK